MNLDKGGLQLGYPSSQTSDAYRCKLPAVVIN